MTFGKNIKAEIAILRQLGSEILQLTEKISSSCRIHRETVVREIIRSEREIQLIDVTKAFKSDEQCLAYLEAMRWPDGVRCPICGNQRSLEDHAQE